MTVGADDIKREPSISFRVLSTKQTFAACMLSGRQTSNHVEGATLSPCMQGASRQHVAARGLVVALPRAAESTGRKLD